MKKVFAIIAMIGVFSFGMTQSAVAQDEVAAEPVEAVADSAVAQDDSAAVAAEAPVEEVAAPEEEVVEEEVSIFKNLKTKFIEGDAGFMSLVAIALIIGLALCIERIIYLSLAGVNSKKLMEEVERKLAAGDIEGAKTICRNTRGPVASICYQGLMRADDGLEAVERSVVSYGAVQSSYLERNCSWITLFIAMAPSLGFLGTVIGMVQAFDDIQKAGDISPTVVAGGMKVALITTIFGIVVALILQVFYNYILSRIESLTTQMEDSTMDLLDVVTKYEVAKK